MTRLMKCGVLIVTLFLVSACSQKKAEQSAVEEQQEQREEQQSQVKRVALQIEAQFDQLPAGARIVAPVALDRRYQKITKTEHIIEPKQVGFSGVPERSLDKENLIYVSGVLAEGQATYKANYEVEIRSMRPGVFDSIAGQSYGEFNDPKLKAALKVLSEPASDPHAVVSAAFDKATKGNGSDAYEVVTQFATALKAGGVPHRLVQGLLFKDNSATPHVWLEALLPQLGWAPFDPVLARGAQEGSSDYRGQHPPDRLRVLFGDSFALTKKPKRPELKIASPFLNPRALSGGAEDAGQRIEGKVTYTVSNP